MGNRACVDSGPLKGHQVEVSLPPVHDCEIPGSGKTCNLPLVTQLMDSGSRILVHVGWISVSDSLLSFLFPPTD